MKKKGVVTTTSGGGLQCEFVIHVNAEELKKSVWKLKIIQVLKEAEENGNIRVIAFPALGTGENSLKGEIIHTEIQLQNTFNFDWHW